jgi:hypothetical protein
MNPVYEYIAAIFIMTLVVGYSLYSLNTMSSSQLNIAEEAQLLPVAGRLFDKILLTKGYPEDWGSNIYINSSNLGDFGLSSQYGEMYRLDVNKLMRLVTDVNNMTNPLYMPPTTMGNLTGIYGNSSWSYGFRLLVKSALIINITNGPPVNPPQENEPQKFTVDVTTYSGKYASNAEVSGLYLMVYVDTVGQGQNKTDVFIYGYSIAKNITNWQGRAELNFTVPKPPKQNMNPAYCLIVTANYYGLQSQQIDVIDTIQTLNLLIQGEYLIVDFNETFGVPPSANQIVNITLIELTDNLQILLNPADNETNGMAGQIINKGSKNYQVYHLENQLTDDVVFMGLYVKTRGNYSLVFASRPIVPIAIDYRSHSFAYAGINSDTFSRMVKIGRNSYIAELTVWRMSQ